MANYEISKKLDELRFALRYGTIILEEALGEDAINSVMLHPIFTNDEMKHIDISYAKIRTGEFRLKDGIYPIVEIIQEKDIRRIDITILTEPTNETRIIKILDDQTDRDFIKKWQRLVSIPSTHVAFLVVENGDIRIEVISPKNWGEDIINTSFGTVLLLSSGAFVNYVARVYSLSKIFVELIDDVLWKYDLKKAVSKFADNIFTYEMMRASSIYSFVINNYDAVEVGENKKIAKLVSEMRENPKAYPLPIFPKMSWVRYQDLLLGKYKISSQFFLITQLHFNSKVFTPPDKKILYHNYIVLNNSVTIYDVPYSVMDNYKEYFEGIVEENVKFWTMGLVFVWPNGIITLNNIMTLFNPYLQEGDNILYIPNELSEAILEVLKDGMIEKEIEKEVKESLIKGKNLLKEIMEDINYRNTNKGFNVIEDESSEDWELDEFEEEEEEEKRIPKQSHKIEPIKQYQEVKEEKFEQEEKGSKKQDEKETQDDVINTLFGQNTKIKAKLKGRINIKETTQERRSTKKR